MSARNATGFDPAALAYDADGLLPVVVQEIASGAVLMVAWADRAAVEKTLASGDAWFWSRSRREPWRKGATSGNTLAVAEVRADCDDDTLLYRVDAAGPACHTGARTCFDRAERIDERQEGGAGEEDARRGAEGQGPEGGGRGSGRGRPEGGVGAGGGKDAPASDSTRSQAPMLELGWLWRVLEERRAALAAGDGDAAESYTARLLAAGVDRVARKLGEEATETVIAALRAAEPGEPGEAGDEGDATERRAALAGEAADLVYHLLVLLMVAGASPADVASELRRRHAAPRRPAAPKPEEGPA